MQKLTRSLFAIGALVGLAACGDDISVTPPTPTPNTVTSVSVLPSSATLKVGESVIFSASVATTGTGVATTVNWTPADPTIATVDANGKVTGVNPGQTTIRATSTADASKVGAALVIVSASQGIRSITPNPAAVTLAPGQVQQISANVDADPGIDRSVTFTTDNASVATVSSTGAITAVAAGTATIKVASTIDPSVFANVAVTVRAPVVAAVSIQSITIGNTNTPVNISNTWGQIDVSINFNSNDEAVSSVDLLVDNKVVASQVFSAASQSAFRELSAYRAANVAPAPKSAAATAASDVIVLSFRTDNFDPTTGAVDFLNGAHSVQAVANVATATRASNTIQLVFNNNDGFYVTLDNAPKNQIGAVTKSAISPTTGLLYVQGDVVITTVPVIYSPTTPGGTTPNTVCIRTIFFPGATPVTVGATGACVTGPHTDTLILPQGPGGYLSTGLDTPTVNGVFTTGNPIQFNLNPLAPVPPQGIVNLGIQPAAGQPIFGLRFDNASPTISTVDLTRTAPAVTGWVNAPFNFLDNGTSVVASDPGVGLATDQMTQYEGCPFMSTGKVWIDMPTSTGADIPECATDFTGGATPGPYTVRVTQSDLLGNSGSSAESGRFGVDKTNPIARFNATATSADLSVSQTSRSFQTEGFDERSGFLQGNGTDGALSEFIATANGTTAKTGTCSLAPDAFGTGTPGAAFVTAPTCGYVTQPVVYPVLADGYNQGPLHTVTTAGYFTYDGAWTDQAGNSSFTGYRHVAVDPAAPQVTGLFIPPMIDGSAWPAFQMTFTDDVEGIAYNFSLNYPEVGLLRYPQTVQYTKFDDVISTPGTFTFGAPTGLTGPFAERVEIVDAASMVQPAVTVDPNAKPTSVVGTAFDVFGNAGFISPVAILNGNVADGTAFEDFNLATPANAIGTWQIIPLSAGFNAPSGLKAQVVTTTNSTNAPFARVDFYRSVAGEWWYLGSSYSATPGNNTTNRFWTYNAPATFALSPTGAPQGAAAAGDVIIAIGVTSAGDGLSSLATVLVP